MSELNGKVVVIAGGAGLIGTALCRGVALAGARVVICDRDAGRAQAVASSLQQLQLPQAVETICMDITQAESIETAIETVVARCGKIDALVNSAYPKNGNYGRHFFDVEYADFCENINLHLGGYFLTSKLFAQYFRDNGAGCIVNIASIYGSVPPRFQIYRGTDMTVPVEYAMIKAALIQLTRYMASYLKGTGVRVNSLSPGGVLDAQPEAFLQAYREHCASKGMLDPEDLVATLVYLLADAAQFVNGQNIVVDDGFTL